jgi:hypothetical protein
MPNLPSATLVIDEASHAPATGLGPIVVLACVSASADSVPRQMASTKSILDLYGYSPGADYAAMHMEQTGKPVIFVGMPITTAGSIGQQDTTGVTGTSLITVTAASSGVMEEMSVILTVTQGTTVGTDQIKFNLSLDGGVSSMPVSLGTNLSYTVPYVGIVLNFGAGTLVVNDVFTCTTFAPMWGSTALSTARAALVAQQTLSRSWMVVGDLPNSTFAGYVTTETNAYETANQRYVYARAQVKDRRPISKMSKVEVHMTGAPSLTFDSVGHTITRATGSFLTDGFANVDTVTVSGSASNNGTKTLSGLSATVMTFASGIVAEGPGAGASIIGSESLTFASTTCTRTGGVGSFVLDGFAIGQTVIVSGTASNNVTVVLTGVSATVLTVAAGFAAEGPIESIGVNILQSLPMATWMTAEATAFASVDAQKRVDLGAGKAAVQSPITGYMFRRPSAWAASIREYQHDVQIPTYRKADGPLDGFSLTDTNGNKIEFDERVDGGGLAGCFTVLRSYSNGPLGAFVALSLTRDSEGNILSRTHNMAVADVACTTVQAETENSIGQVLVLNDSGTGTEASLSIVEQRVNTALQIALLQNFSEGPRASKAVWTASRTDNLSVPGATLNGVLDLELDGTLEQIATRVVVS